MSKKIKMVLYGEPGVGKSVFASKAPRPFFICTDGNYEWLEDFGAKPEDHIQVDSWEDVKKAVDKDYPGYETIVLDLTEDCYKWAEYEFCVRSKIDHIGDIGYGKGYDIVRNDYFLTICKLLNKDKNVILIMHGNTFSVKDRRGVEHVHHGPTTRIPDKVMDQIEGRVRYFLRCYLKAEETDEGVLLKRRYLSLVPKENEFGIIRGVDENKIPHDIPLDWTEFVKAIGFDGTESTHVVETAPVEEKPQRAKKKAEEPAPTVTPETTDTQEVVEQAAKAEPEKKEEQLPFGNEIKPTETVVEPTKELSQEEKIAAIKAKLAAMKK